MRLFKNKWIEFVLVILLFLAILFVLPDMVSGEDTAYLNSGSVETIAYVKSRSGKPSGVNLMYFANGKDYLTKSYPCCFYLDLPYGFPFYVRYSTQKNRISEVLFSAFPYIWEQPQLLSDLVEVKGKIIQTLDCKSGNIPYVASKAIYEYEGQSYFAFYYGRQPLTYGEEDSCRVMFHRQEVYIGFIVGEGVHMP
jgi:hypothetical protein